MFGPIDNGLFILLNKLILNEMDHAELFALTNKGSKR